MWKTRLLVGASAAAALLVLSSLVSVAESVPLVKKESDASALVYLLNHGYIKKGENEDTAQLLSAEGLKEAIQHFQAFAGLDVTGELDDETVELMNTPRCGVPDVVGHGSEASRRKKRYALQGSRWRTKRLTYRITKYPSTGRLSKADIDGQIKEAFTLWERETNLKFERKNSGSVHIEIRFEKGEHGDGDPFDGPGRTLAHAYFPQFGGDAHFDDEEYWTINQFRGTNVLQTAAHEFGHSLGLSHSDVRSALMAPFYRGWEPNLKLNKDDVEAIQALYGKPSSVAGSEEDDDDDDTPPTPSADEPSSDDDNGGGRGDNRDLCQNSDVDTIFNTGDGNYYVFKGSNYWKLTDDSVADGYPRKIADDWKGLPNNIDAALTWTDNDKTYFFKGSQYWKFDNMDPEPGYPKSIEGNFDGIPNNVDAAFVWGGNGKMYFFKGNRYWKFDPSRKPPVRSVYPRSLRNWDLPRNIRAAVKWTNGYTYFFTKDEYYRFNDRRFTVDEADPPFPRDSGVWWFGCKADDLRTAAAVKKEEAVSVKVFDEEGPEALDAYAGDED